MDTDPETNNILIQLVVILVLMLINAFFAGAEMALVSVNKSRLNMLSEEGNKKAKLIQKLLNEPTRFLSTIQVAITLSGFFASASAATGISKSLASSLEHLNIPYTEQISFVFVTVLLSFITLVYGELVPKRIALQKAESFSMFAVPIVVMVSKIAAPFVKLLTMSTNLTLKLIGMKAENLEEMISREEIQSMVAMGMEQGVFNDIEHEMINSIIEFDDKLAREIMTPRINVFAIDVSKPREEYFDGIFEKKFSRIPVYEEDIDNIVGVLYIKDLLREAKKNGFDNIDIRKILHKPYLVPDTKNIDELFKEMQHLKKYFAVLINEYGEFSGIVTIEDLVEEVMGDIEDEYDRNTPGIIKIDEHTALLEGLVSVDDINSKFDLDLDTETADTISGLVIDRLGYIPVKGEHITVLVDGIKIDILSVSGKRIDKLKIHLPEEIKEED